jgi:Ca-activated chloride channel family protein
VVVFLRVAGVETAMAQKSFELSLLTAISLCAALLSGPQVLSQSTVYSTVDSAHIIDTALHANASTADRPSRLDSIRVSVDLVLVPVTVTDDLNHPQTNLARENFAVYERDQPQKIRYFSAEDSPISVGLLLDVSASMQDKIDTERAAIEQFFKNANPEDDYFVITFNNQPHVLSDVTRSTSGIETELGLVHPSGTTALLDAVYLGVSKLERAQYRRRALVIISDGADNASRYKLSQIKSIVAESDVMVYAIGIFGTSPFKSFEETMGKRWLGSMTDVSGGRTTTVKNLSALPEACALLSRELRTQYVVGYHPSEILSDGKWHKIKVVVKNPSDAEPFRSFYRKGYFASQP